jgi:hypothetical protein
MRHKCRSLNSVVLLPSTPPDSPPPDDNKGLRAAIPPVTTHTSCPRSTYNSPRPNGVLATSAWRFCTNRETVGQPFSHSCVQSLNRRTAALGFDAITRPRLRLQYFLPADDAHTATASTSRIQAPHDRCPLGRRRFSHAASIARHTPLLPLSLAEESSHASHAGPRRHPPSCRASTMP